MVVNEIHQQEGNVNINGYNFLLHDYCEYCEYFSPEIEQLPIKVAWGETTKYNNNIRCKNRKLCARLMEHLEKKHGQTTT